MTFVPNTPHSNGYLINVTEDTLFVHWRNDKRVRVFDMATQAEVDFNDVLKSKVHDIMVVDDSLVALTAITRKRLRSPTVATWQHVAIRCADL